ncbi:hypothetical protein [Planomonospora sp. ID82291]|uniref:hypothetical protein n=1 Tax=Planomonospora sp. ID82291 TaxID=2738136 RepID=UPI0018C39407|nr:hypothetical protein [Planomonospora sp. ID82291]MBG0818648.1 hypothetical protein [Planomonospora sp. ID82291]
MTADQRRALAELTRACGLGTEAIPEPLHDDLMAAVASAENQLHALLNHQGTLTSRPLHAAANPPAETTSGR